MTPIRRFQSMLMVAVLLMATSCADSPGGKNEKTGAQAGPGEYSYNDIWLVLHSDEITSEVSMNNGPADTPDNNDDTTFMPQAQAETPGHDGVPDIKAFIDMNKAMGLDAMASAIFLRMLNIF